MPTTSRLKLPGPGGELQTRAIDRSAVDHAVRLILGFAASLGLQISLTRSEPTIGPSERQSNDEIPRPCSTGLWQQ
jgi:hypothetical protein